MVRCDAAAATVCPTGSLAVAAAPRDIGGASSCRYGMHIAVVSSQPAHFIFSWRPGLRASPLTALLFLQITRVIFCVFLETDFVIYKRKMSLLFQGMCVYSKLTGLRVINPASLHLIYYPLICCGELANELMNT